MNLYVIVERKIKYGQCIPSKRHYSRPMKETTVYMLCEPNGYVWNVLIYCGKLDLISGFGLAETIALKLMEKLLDCGRVLYVDNF